MIRILALLLLSCLVAFGQPAPILRNSWSTNTAGQPVKGFNNLSITNASVAGTNWEFFGISPRTVARLGDISAAGGATNAVNTIESNGVVIATSTTNLNFVNSPSLTWLLTNSPSGKVHISATATGSGGGGETNWVGDAGTTNATRIGLADGKANNTNLIKTLMAGNGIVLTNNVGGTNVMIAIDPAIVASQTDLNSASNVLRGLVGETNWNGDAGITNATRIGLADGKANNTNLIKTLMGGVGIFLTNNVGGTNVMIAVDPVLANLIGTVANNVTNVVSLSTSNALSKPITNLYSAGVLTLRGIEAGANITITANPSNYVIAAAGGGSGSLAIQTNRVNLGTETNLNVMAGNGILILATNLSGTNDMQFVNTAPGETNFNGEIGTNATHYGWVYDKINNTNRLRSISVGPGLVLTNFGTNLMLQIDPLVVTTNVIVQTNSVLVNQGPVLNFLSTASIIPNFAAAGGSTLLSFDVSSTVLSNRVAVAAGWDIMISSNGVGSVQVYTVAFTNYPIIDIKAPPYSATGDGVTDDTLAFRNAATNVGATIMVPYTTTGYLITNVFITNGVTIQGAGAQASKLIFNPTGTGYMFDGHTNNFGITLRNLELYGTNDSASYSGVSAAGTRSGIKLMGYANGNKLDSLYIHGFDNQGVWIGSTNTSTLVTVVAGSNNASVVQCDFRRNFIGLDISDSLSEYVRVDNCRAYEHRFGFRIGSGSALLTGCEALTNRFAFYIYGTNNDGHGSIVDAIINHNVYPLTFDAVANGFLVDSCQIWEGIVWITNSTMVQIQNCMGSVGEWQCSTGGRCWVRNNRWFTTFGNTVTHSFGGGAADLVIFSDNIANNGTVIGDQSLYVYSNAVFQGNVSLTNASGTNFVSGYVNTYAALVSNRFAIINLNPQYGSYLVVTNAATGDAFWSTNRGFIRLPVHSYLAPTNAPAALDQGTNNTWRLLFDDTANESAYYQFTLPDDYYTNANLLISYSTLAAAASKSNVWRVAVMVVKPNTATINTDAYNGFVEITNQVPSTAGLLQNVMLSCNATSAVAGDLIKLQLMRIGTNTFGKNTGDSAVHDLTFEYDKGPIK